MHDDLAEQLADLFQETGDAHQAAFRNADDNAEWPLWYADYLMDKLPELLGDADFTKSELVYLLITVDRELKTLAPGAHWPTYYANFFMDRYML